jgi:hypothetical protein
VVLSMRVLHVGKAVYEFVDGRKVDEFPSFKQSERHAP